MLFRSGIVDTDLRKAISKKHLNISSGVKRFVEDDSPSDCIQGFLVKAVGGYEIRGGSRLKTGVVIYELQSFRREVEESTVESPCHGIRPIRL